MGQKKNNLAEGRLGVPSLTRPDSAGRIARKKTNYGVGRLGITSDDEQDRTGQEQESPNKQGTPAAAAVQTTVSAAPKEPTDRVQSVREDMERRTEEPAPLWYKAIFAPNRRKMLLLAAGGLGTMLVVGLVLLVWSFDGEEVGPQSASAKEQKPSVPARNVAGQKHTPATNAKQPVETNLTKSTSATEKPIPPVSAKTPEPPMSASAGHSVTLKGIVFRQALRTLAELRRNRTLGGFQGRLTPRPNIPPPVRVISTPRPARPVVPSAPRLASEVVVKTQTAPRPNIRLTGIMRGPDGRVALINNRFVKVGQKVNNARVVRIRNFSVEVKYKGQLFLIGIATRNTSINTPMTNSDEEDESSDDKKPEETEKK